MSLAILIVGHGSPRAEANAALTGMVERIAARVDGVRIAPAFFSIASPSIPHVVAELAEGGATRFVLAPYFLYEGQHVTVDVPKLLATCRERYPDATFEVLPTLQDAPALEDLMVARVQAFAPVPELPTEGAAIERRSHAIIDRRLGPCDDEGVRAIVRRVVHAAADYSFAESLRIHPDAVERGIAALREQRPIVCDVNMLKAGLTKVGVDVLCSVSDPDIIERAGPDMTRSAAAMEKLAERY
ncbi:precorrin-8X methylmutase, partial [bacterium]|nr:precorrin-8X methylmutase [bacterium]